MWEEATEIELLGLVLRADQWITFANELDKAGESGTAAMFFRSLYKYAKDNDDIQLQEQCVEGLNSIYIPPAYKRSGASDPSNRPRRKWVRDKEVDIFDFKLDEGVIIEALREIDFKDLKERRYWFVVQRVFKELDWLSITMDTKFADWVAFYFQWPWERNNPWRTVEKEIRETNSWQWNKYTVPGDDIGDRYAALAQKLWSTFTDKPKRSKEDKPDDKRLFYLPNMFKINNGNK